LRLRKYVRNGFNQT